MSRVILHIGTHKTGSTSLQETFADNAALLANHGLIYPRLGPVAGHHGLAADWNPLLQPYALAEGSRTTLAALARQYGPLEHTVFLSSEEFSRGREGGRVDFRALRQALSGFSEIKVICVLREQWRFIQSVYLEVSKVRQPKTPAQFLDDTLRNHMVMGLWTDYARLYTHLLTAFAPEEITFLDYQTCRTAPDGLLGAILTQLDLGHLATSLTPADAKRSNISPPPLAIWAANHITTPDPAPPWLTAATTGALGVEYGEGRESCIWSAEQLSQLRDYAQKTNAPFCAKVASTQPGFALSASIPDQTALCPADLDASFWRRTNRWAFAIMQGPPQP